MRAARPLHQLIAAVGSPYGTLLLALSVMMLLYPFTGSSPLIRWALDLLLLGVVGAALRTAHGRGSRFHLLWMLGLAAVVARVAARSLDIDAADPLAAGLWALFFTSLVVVVLGDIFRRQKVTMDAVLGASSAFVLMGLAWGSLYMLVETLQPGSFLVPAAPQWIQTAYGSPLTEFDLHYFSFVAMTTIGFGDIVPLTPPVRGMAALQGLLAQLFLAIIVARLVGLEIANRLGGAGS